uniref:protein BNIP5 isoform X2 n=1 Tax=Myodes glareolus TaxID=447135 RepID=UPI002021DF73|nr:protein BNIP5 isoform X2 [Myodes glareolus]
MPRSRNPSPGKSRDGGDFRGLSPIETQRGPKKPPTDKRTQSLDRQVLKDSESANSKYSSGPTHRKVLRRTASDETRGSGSPYHFAEAQEAVAAAPPLGEESEFLPCEQGPVEGPKKERPPKQAQQSWISMFLNVLFLRFDLEEPREKASKKSKGKGEIKLPEATEEPAVRKKSQEKRTSRKKPTHKKPAPEEPSGPQNSEAEGHENLLPSRAASHAAEEANLGLICRETPDSEILQALPTEGGHAESSESSAQAAGPPLEEDPQQPDQDELIWKIVELLKRAGDRLEEEQAQVPQPEVAPQKPTPPPRKKSQEKKSTLKKALSLKRPASEEPKRVAAAALGPETRPKRPSFLPLCLSGQRLSASSNPDSEEPGFHEVQSVDPGCSHLSECHTPAACQGPAERPPRDRAYESREFRRKILVLLKNAEEQKGEQQAQVQEAEEAGENSTPAPKVKSHRKKSNLRRAFSLKKHGSKDPKRTEASGTPGAASPEARPPKRHGFLPTCVSGHRASISGDPEDLEFQKLEAAGGEPVGSPEAPFRSRRVTPDEQPLPVPEGASESSGSVLVRLELPTTCNDLSVGFLHTSAQTGNKGLRTQLSGSPVVAARSWPPQEQVSIPDVRSPQVPSVSEESIIRKLVEGLQEVDDDLGRQIRQYPSFRDFFNQFSEASLRKLVATLERQKARLAEEDSSLVNRPPPCAFGSLNKFAANHSCAICTLMQSRGQYQGHSYAHFLSRKAQQNIMSLDGQSPD